jgi:hypothetical protein
MALSERHRWCVRKIQEAFGPEADDEMVQGFIRTDANRERFANFFRGEGHGRLIVYFQPQHDSAEVCACMFVRAP